MIGLITRKQAIAECARVNVTDSEDVRWVLQMSFVDEEGQYDLMCVRDALSKLEEIRA